jgi:hypothetical protein
LLGLTAAWIGCFLYLGLASRLPSVPWLTGRGESVAYSGHFFTTLILAVLFFALLRTLDFGRPTRHVALASLIVAGLAGGAIELLQGLSRTRSPQFEDWLFDGLGALLGIGVLAVVDARIPLRPRLVAGAQVFGGFVVVFTVSAFFIWPPPAPQQVAAFCPPGVKQRAVPVQPVPRGTGSRVDDGLVALYPFETSADDTSGVAPALDLRLSGSAVLRTGALAITGADGVAASEGAAAKIFEGATATDAFTIEAWVRPDDLLQRGPARIVTASSSTSLGDVNFHLGQERTCVSFRVSAGGGEAEWLLTTRVFSVPQPVWQIVVTYDGGTVGIYADGEFREQFVVEPGSLAGWDPGLPLSIGNEATLDRAFQGDIHLVAIYDRSLEASEIAENYRAGANAG